MKIKTWLGKDLYDYDKGKLVDIIRYVIKERETYFDMYQEEYLKRKEVEK